MGKYGSTISAARLGYSAPQKPPPPPPPPLSLPSSRRDPVRDRGGGTACTLRLTSTQIKTGVVITNSVNKQRVVIAQHPKGERVVVELRYLVDTNGRVSKKTGRANPD
jgi:hypothetical protein